MDQVKEHKKADPSPATLLSTPKQKQAVTGEETLLVTETFHLPTAPKKASGRLSEWRSNRKLLLCATLVSAGICFLGSLLLFQNTKKNDTETTNRVSLENRSASVASPSPLGAKKEDPILPLDAQKKRIEQAVSQDNEEKTAPQVASDHGEQQKTGKDHTPDLAAQHVVPGIKPVARKINEDSSSRNTTTPPAPRTATATAFSNVFSYGARSDARLASPGTAEASLRSSRTLRNNMTFSYGSHGVKRRKKSKHNQLRFKIKESGTRSVK